MDFNINYYVKVKLTKTGRDILKNDPMRTLSVDEDENGYSKWQMWDLMATFGKYIHMGGNLPFETNIIIEEQ